MKVTGTMKKDEEKKTYQLGGPDTKEVIGT